MTGFEVKNLTYSYRRGRDILHDISMECEPGSINALIGLNGCGKTTLIKTVSGMYRPNSGSVLYNGKNIHTLSDPERSKIIAYVKQHGNHISGYTVQDYLLFSTANTLKTYEVPGKKEIDRVQKCMGSLGISEMATKNIGELSGGQRQLVFICAALVQNSDIILLDEPTSALDMKNEYIVLNCLRNIASKTGKTILMSTHRPNQAQYLDANVFLMKDGRIINRGPSREIINVENLKQIYGEGICVSSEQPYEEISYRCPQ